MMTMRRAAALFALALVSACTTKDTTATNNIPASTAPNEFNRTYTLQGFVADATTGARLGGDLQLFLVQGADVRTPTRLNAGATDPLLGEYAFAGIPADYNANNKTYKVIAVKPGYERFESEITFRATVITPIAGTPIELDTIYNSIGNIYMFPIGSSAPTYTFTVTYNGKPVPNATVLLDPAPNTNDALYNTAHVLPSTTGYIASLQATTNTSGVATFAGSTLALGAAYSAQVLPLTFTDSAGSQFPLARFDGTPNVTVGLSNVDQRIAMSDLVDTATNLYVVSASNQATGQIFPNGALVIQFNAPVTLKPGATGFSAAISGTTTSTIGTPQVFANLSTDGRTLTLTPNLSAPLGLADANVVITYGNGTAFVEATDYPGVQRLVFGGVPFSDGATTVAQTVMMRAP